MTLCKRPIVRIAIALAAATTVASAAAWAEQLDSTGKSRLAAAQPSLKALEAEFWACDYTATTRGLAATDSEACMANFEALKKAKFGGDFAGLVAWWQRNKVAEYLALAQSQQTVAGR